MAVNNSLTFFIFFFLKFWILNYTSHIIPPNLNSSVSLYNRIKILNHYKFIITSLSIHMFSLFFYSIILGLGICITSLIITRRFAPLLLREWREKRTADESHTDSTEKHGCHFFLILMSHLRHLSYLRST